MDYEDVTCNTLIIHLELDNVTSKCKWASSPSRVLLGLEKSGKAYTKTLGLTLSSAKAKLLYDGFTARAPIPSPGLARTDSLLSFMFTNFTLFPQTKQIVSLFTNKAGQPSYPCAHLLKQNKQTIWWAWWYKSCHIKMCKKKRLGINLTQVLEILKPNTCWPQNSRSLTSWLFGWVIMFRLDIHLRDCVQCSA